MLEIIVASMTKKDQSKRKKVTWITGVLIFLVGVPSALSFGVLSEFTIFGQTIIDFFDYIVSNILMPLGALAIAIFTFTRIPKETLFREISMGSTKRHQLFALWFLVIKYIVPVSITVVFLDVIGLFDQVGSLLHRYNISKIPAGRQLLSSCFFFLFI